MSGGGEQSSRAKQPRTVVAGPYAHPFHPLLVTVPIGAWVASIVFDLLSLVVAEPGPFAHGAAWLIGLGVVGALVAALVGFLDYVTIPTGTRAHRVATLHMGVNLVATTVFAVGLVLRLPVDAASVSSSHIAVSGLGLALVSVGGWLGGELTYRYGVRVADERTQARGFDPHDERSTP